MQKDINMKFVPKKYAPAVVAVTALLIMAGMIGIMANCIGILFAAIREDMGFRAGDLSLYYTLKSLASALSLTLTVKFALSRYGRIIMAVYGLVAACSVGAMYFFDSLWQWYFSGIICGIAAGCTFTVVPIVLNNWFQKNNGMVIGLIMSGSGLAGTIFSPIISKIITGVGWREAALIMAVLTILMVSLPAILFFQTSPDAVEAEVEKKKRKDIAAGAGKNDAAAVENTTGRNISGQNISAQRGTAQSNPAHNDPAQRSTDQSNTARKNPLPSWVFPVCLLIIMIPAMEITFANQLTTFATVIGYSISVGGYMTSLAMAGNVSGKFLLGLLADKMDIFKAIRLMIYLSMLAMVLFLFAGTSSLVAMGGSLAFGFIYSLYSTGPALFLVKIYGKKDYVRNFSRMQAINTFMVAICSSAIAYVYDLTGSYSPVFLICLLANAGMLYLLHLLA